MLSEKGYVLIDAIIVMFILMMVVNVVFLCVLSLDNTNNLIDSKIMEIDLIYE